MRISLAIASSIVFCNLVFSSGVPTADPVSHFQFLQAELRKQKEYLANKIGFNGLLKSTQESAKAQVDAVNNAAANSIVRMNLHETKLEEFRQKLANAPLDGSCDIMTDIQNYEDIVCDVLQKKRDDVIDNVSALTFKRGSGGVQYVDADTASVALSKEMLDEIEKLRADSSVDIPGVDAGLTGGAVGPTLTKGQEKSAKLFDKIILGNTVIAPPKPDTMENQKTLAEVKRREAYLNLIANTLAETTNVYVSIDDKPSIMQGYEDFISRYTDEEFVASVMASTGKSALNNFDKETGKKIKDENTDLSIEQVGRHQLLVSTMQNRLMLEIYKTQQRQSQLQAAMLSINVNPLPPAAALSVEYWCTS